LLVLNISTAFSHSLISHLLITSLFSFSNLPLKGILSIVLVISPNIQKGGGTAIPLFA
jgi:hypothetical protein